MRAVQNLLGGLTVVLAASAAWAGDLAKGKDAPAWNITDAKGLPATSKLADFKGKWVVLDFWGYWCPPCVGTSMPAWIKFQEQFQDKSEHFAIITVHDTTRGVTNVEQLLPKLETLKTKKWGGKDLPFPVLFDTTGKTMAAYEIRAFPTAVLIDPQGKVVEIEVGYNGQMQKRLSAELAKVSVAKAKPDAGATPAADTSTAGAADQPVKQGAAKKDDERPAVRTARSADSK